MLYVDKYMQQKLIVTVKVDHTFLSFLVSFVIFVSDLITYLLYSVVFIVWLSLSNGARNIKAGFLWLIHLSIKAIINCFDISVVQ